MNNISKITTHDEVVSTEQCPTSWKKFLEISFFFVRTEDPDHVIDFGLEVITGNPKCGEKRNIQAAKILEVHKNTITNWASRDTNVGQPIKFLLKAANKFQTERELLESYARYQHRKHRHSVVYSDHFDWWEDQ